MKRDAYSYIKTCVTCNKTDAFRPKHSETLQKLEPLAVEMGDRIHLDLLDMPKSTMGHVAICKLVDAATGFIITNPVFDKTSKGVGHTIMEKYILTLVVLRSWLPTRAKKTSIQKFHFFLKNSTSNMSLLPLPTHNPMVSSNDDNR